MQICAWLWGDAIFKYGLFLFTPVSLTAAFNNVHGVYFIHTIKMLH